MLEVEKQYATRSGAQAALRPTSLEIGAGEFVSIVGPSGCGKTTLMKMVAGLL
ncbi:MAG TPA: ATP-binding cassette domain-containing protein, partial [Candidatus Dormibacteraeota bacterium]|nr:ATP-binding cassette domain-containing protein [Candidatus Dormibacteraeota bacterium]